MLLNMGAPLLLRLSCLCEPKLAPRIHLCHYIEQATARSSPAAQRVCSSEQREMERSFCFARTSTASTSSAGHARSPKLLAKNLDSLKLQSLDVQGERCLRTRGTEIYELSKRTEAEL